MKSHINKSPVKRPWDANANFLSRHEPEIADKAVASKGLWTGQLHLQ